MKTHINTLGIFLATIGSFLVWRYIKILSFVDHDEYEKGNGVLVIAGPTEKELKEFKRSKFLSNFGVYLIMIGGFLQLVSNYFPENFKITDLL